ncbi:MAG: hypothetical protein CMJ51_03855 [Planctomycetaceae bacterium]|nr:hypothetical protein [Planctomycetaceae bacterium]
MTRPTRFSSFLGPCLALGMVVLSAWTPRSVLGSSGLGGDPVWEGLHLESFEFSTSPTDRNGPRSAMEWCRTEGRQVGNGFCPTGGAWRLGPGESIAASIRLTVDCGRIRIWTYVAGLDTTGSSIRLGVSDGGCGVQDGIQVPIQSTGGACVDLAIEDLAPTDGDAILVEWFNGGASVMLIDEVFVEGSDCDSAASHACCEVGAAGCIDEVTEACVCELDPFCCETAWDATCVATVSVGGCGDCGVDCLPGLSLDFGETYIPGGVCLAFPDLFEACDGAGPYLTTSGSCAGPDDVALRFGGGFPWSTIETRCLDLDQAGSARLRFQCETQPGVPGPVIEARLADGTLLEIARVPLAFDSGCRPIDVDLTPILGGGPFRLRFASGSSVADATRMDEIRIELDPPHDPCEIGTPGSSEPEIDACVCAIDVFCCEEGWDETCVAIAATICGACESIPSCGLNGPCDQVRPLPGCDDQSCCETTCGIDPYCCVIAWDAPCVSISNLECGSPSPDLDGDGIVGGADLGILLADWGRQGGPADLDRDGVVSGGDLGIMLASWG